jgi:hypothetical protein
LGRGVEVAWTEVYLDALFCLLRDSLSAFACVLVISGLTSAEINLSSFSANSETLSTYWKSNQRVSGIMMNGNPYVISSATNGHN